MLTPRPRVLVVDDAAELRELLHDYLAGQGYDVVTAATGADALDAVTRNEPDVIVLDMWMPGLSGLEVLGALRRAGSTVPVIAISGSCPVGRDGFFAALQKPFTLRDLARLVAAAVADRRQQA